MMDTFQFIVALAREAGAPFAFAVGAVVGAISLPFIVLGVRRTAERQARLSADRDIEIKRLEVSVRNGAVALAKPQTSPYPD
jgi:hypothetical protein